MSSYQAAYKTTYNVVNDIIKILSKDRAPVCDMPPGIKSDLHPDSQEEFIQFSLLTHGFGTPAHLAGLTTFTTGLQEAHRALSAPSEFCKAIQRPVPTAVKSALLDHFVTSNQGHG
uniref:TF_AP-2 domain-containing protein n=1 Tax=Panagrellus redivivus TaxID=6233 RepID=A0A7E4V701_PANRE